MPGLVRRTRSPDVPSLENDTPSSLTPSKCSKCSQVSAFPLRPLPKPSPAEKMPSSTNARTPLLPTTTAMISSSITYIPPQIDSLANCTARTASESPFKLLVWDVLLLIKMLPYLPRIFLPATTSDAQSEMYPNLRGVWDMLLQGWLGFTQTLLLVLAPVTLFVLPGGISLLLAGVVGLGTWAVAYPMQGPDIVYSAMDETTVASAKEHEDERWLFINGVCSGNRGLQVDLDRLAKTFGRPIIGVHNKTYGLIADLLESTVQRCMSLNTQDVRVAFDYVKASLADPTIKKVVLIGHSQGAVIVSLVLDNLFANLPSDSIAKLEVYTFGSAASHVSNPLLHLPGTKHTIPHIEHYVNSLDPIPCWGVLHAIHAHPRNRYSGSVFIRDGATGHFLNQHYLDTMFSLDAVTASEFLDSVVRVEDSGEDGKKQVRSGMTVRQLSRLWRYADGGSPGPSGMESVL